MGITDYESVVLEAQPFTRSSGYFLRLQCKNRGPIQHNTCCVFSIQMLFYKLHPSGDYMTDGFQKSSQSKS